MSAAVLSNLSARDRRALALLVPAAGLILLARFIILPAWDAAGDASRSLEIREKLLRKHQAIVAAVPVKEVSAGAIAQALTDA